jgi:ABC-2 type transport system permease protein
MLLRNIFTKQIRDLRWPTFWAALSLGIGGAYFTWLYPTYTKAFDLNKMLSQMPESMRALIGGADLDISTATGFLNVELFPLILPAVLAGFAVAMASGFTAGEESRGTIDVLLSYPVPRWRVVVDKSVALVLSLVAIGAIMLGGIELGSVASNSPVELDKVAAGLVMASTLAIAFGMIALALAAWTGNRGPAAGVPIGLLVFMYLDQTLSPQVEALRSINFLSLFHYYLGNNPLRHGLSLTDTAVLAVVALVFLALGVVAFERRDLAS